MTERTHYRVKEVFYTLQGEGAQAGRPAVKNVNHGASPPCGSGQTWATHARNVAPKSTHMINSRRFSIRSSRSAVTWW